MTSGNQTATPSSNLSEVLAMIEAFRAGADDFDEVTEIVIELPFEPASIQSSRSKKDVLSSALRSITEQSTFYLTGDVHIEVEWLLSLQARYETDKSPDVDNILKPLLDPLCGPKGIMIDDCQVQSVVCYWVDWDHDGQHVSIKIEFNADEWLLKEDLVFIDFGKGRCFPVTWPPSSFLLDMVEDGLRRRDDTGDYFASRGLMPIQRLFHITRVAEFRVIGIEAARAQLEGIEHSQ